MVVYPHFVWKTIVILLFVEVLSCCICCIRTEIRRYDRKIYKIFQKTEIKRTSYRICFIKHLTLGALILLAYQVTLYKMSHWLWYSNFTCYTNLVNNNECNFWQYLKVWKNILFLKTLCICTTQRFCNTNMYKYICSSMPHS